jgi:MSHA biogenesis protein MshP
MSLITAIFLLVVLAALGALMVSISSVQHTESALDLEGSRAYHAARSGLEYGAFQATTAGCPGPAGTTTTTNVALQPVANFDAFSTVTVSCTNQGAHNEAGNSQTLYLIVANVCNQPAAGACPNPAPGANYVERELQQSVIQ